MTVHNNVAEPWKVTLVDTGLTTMTGGRIKRVQKYIGDETFMLTYGDGVSDINIQKLLRYHQSHGKIATITAANIGQRFGILDIADTGEITSFREKDGKDGGRINAGYMVMNPEIFDYIDGDTTVFEQEPLERIVEKGELMAYQFDGYWQCMDTKREMDRLNALWDAGSAPWKVWEE